MNQVISETNLGIRYDDNKVPIQEVIRYELSNGNYIIRLRTQAQSLGALNIRDMSDPLPYIIGSVQLPGSDAAIYGILNDYQEFTSDNVLVRRWWNYE